MDKTWASDILRRQKQFPLVRHFHNNLAIAGGPQLRFTLCHPGIRITRTYVCFFWLGCSSDVGEWCTDLVVLVLDTWGHDGCNFCKIFIQCKYFNYKQNILVTVKLSQSTIAVF